MTPPDTEVQEKLGIRYDFAPAPINKRQDEIHNLGLMILQADDWGKAPLTQEFVSRLGEFILPWDLEEMRGRAVSDHRNVSNEGSLPIINKRPARHTRSNICRACFRGWRTAGTLHEHKRYCHVNREAYMKIKALGLTLRGNCSGWLFVPCDDLLKALPDSKSQEKIGIRFDYIRNIKGSFDSDRLFDENVRSQLKAWGQTPLTKEFVSNLGYPSNLELLETRRLEEMGPTGPYQESLDDLLDFDTPKKRALLDPNATPPRKRNRTSGPLPLESIREPSSIGPTMSQISASAPSLHNTTAQDERQLKATNQGHEAESSAKDPSPTNDGTSRFDVAFSSWLNREKVSKAAVGRLVKDPTLQPLTGLMTRNYIESLKLDSGDEIEDEDEELVSRICGMPLSDIFYKSFWRSLSH